MVQSLTQIIYECIVKSTHEFQAKLSWNGVCCQLYPLFSEYYLSVSSALTCRSTVTCCISWLSFSRVFWSVDCLALNQEKKEKKKAAGNWLCRSVCYMHQWMWNSQHIVPQCLALLSKRLQEISVQMCETIHLFKKQSKKNNKQPLLMIYIFPLF